MFGKSSREKKVQAAQLERKGVSISPEDGTEVLENLDIIEKNREFAQKMVDVEAQMKLRREVLEVNPDTGKVVKEAKKSDFDNLKAETFKETDKELTRHSKYVRGMVIAGLAAAAVSFVPELEYEYNASQILTNIIMSAKDWHIGDLVKFAQADPMAVGSIGGMLGMTCLAFQQAYRAGIQETKTRVASNQKVQRIIAMMASGMTQPAAQSVVGIESKAYGKDRGVFVDTMKPATGIGDHAGYNQGQFASNNETGQQQITEIRKQLDEMGVQRVDRTAFVDKKNSI